MSYLLAFCLALCWGTAFLATKNIVDVIPPYWGTFYRVLAGLLFFAVLYICQGKSLRIELKQLWRPWTIGFLIILFPFAAISWSQRFVAPTIGGIFNGSVPIWSFIAGAILLKGVDRFTWTRACGILMGLVGLLCISWPSLTLGDNPQALYGCMGLLLMAWSYGLGNVLTKKIMVDHSGSSLEANTFHQYLFSAVVLLFIAFGWETHPAVQDFSAKVIVSILFAGVFSSAIAFLLMLALIKRWGATRMASVTYFTPVVAMLADFIFLQRVPSGQEFVGLAIIFLSLFLIQKPIKQN
ncbi:MAG: DMT family transporter [Elusimicrobiaceae bacterium]|nr:DMT family transporter [Elusimicrobiaceae bacterium]